jgi:hypothetical protein
MPVVLDGVVLIDVEIAGRLRPSGRIRPCRRHEIEHVIEKADAGVVLVAALGRRARA